MQKTNAHNRTPHLPAAPANSNLKLPPHAPDLERAIIGALLLNKDKLDEVADILTEPDMFYLPDCRAIYSAMTDILHDGGQPDIHSITQRLADNGQLEQAGGRYGVTMMMGSVVNGAHIATHSCMVREKWERRELINLYREAESKCWEEGEEAADIAGYVDTGTINIIDNGTRGGGATHISESVRDMLAGLELMQQRHSYLTGTDTGLSQLNRITGGWQDTDLIILAARPGKGKTAMGLNLVVSAATSNVSKPKGVLFFSLEMSKRQLLQRITASMMNIPFQQLRNGGLSDHHLSRIVQDATGIAKLPVWIDDRAGLNISQVKAKAKRLKRRHDIGMVVVDYLQLMSATRGRNDNREQEISHISRELKGLAKELDIPVIALSQLNRDVEKRGSPRPHMGDLRESGAIEQDADLILFLYHEPDANNPATTHHMLSIAKHRNGRCEDVELSFDADVQKWGMGSVGL